MARKFTVIQKNADGTMEIEATMRDGAGKDAKLIPFRYTIAQDAKAFQGLVTKATGDTLESMYQSYWYGEDLAARSGARPSTAVETTIVKVKGKDIDLLSFPLDKLVPFLNAKLGAVAADRLLNPDARVPGAVETTIKKLVEQGKVKSVNGKVEVVKK